MRVQRRRRPERLIMIVLIVILAIIVAVYGTLWAAQRPMHQAQKTAYSLAVSKGKLKTTTAFSQYNGTSSYYVVTGTSSKSVPVYALINTNKHHKTTIVKQSAGISRTKALKKVWSKRNPSKVIKATLGEYDGTVVWEITYLNQKKNLCYEILQYSNGNQLKSIINI
ncbi:cell wall elongation regulator TseB-like domain-containing protein [Lactiplantibacillus paraplantarum]|uniref:Cell wall elongation regulator TseB-like domain-containing protein n=2 Tax=Lactiplantibacillus paraplantarum TaxID=60520 RepID=A0A2I9CJP2_9LACO|nr:DUF5590 domain-containing protein [Lactiplantibacillus paraplantarum]AVW10366.1 hypothetical protein DA077_07375 [Lactiplantibacillus paraplantarum]AYJ38612.1 hypothetical protein LP667_07200 [Lactiplantibacillus paraplantarum]ERL44104.1 hypothetical protein N644_1731 [Lactiplantibacillus paraplantarum]MCT4457633.1 hypothetical protein [Lactiplantibacillus paraplantarum]MCW1910263.1 DUF5590 domain-containing protein [Lactiplantibacillus paraplantarum]